MPLARGAYQLLLLACLLFVCLGFISLEKATFTGQLNIMELKAVVISKCP